MKNSRPLRVIAAFPAVLWAGVIYMLSDTPAVESTNESLSFTGMLLDLVSRFIYVDPAKRDMIIIAMEPHIRKIAHMTEFGILFLLVLIPAVLFIKKLSLRTGITLLITLLYAVSDEIHQLFVPGRSGMLRDVVIDFLGALIALGLYLVIIIIIRTVRKHIAASK